MEFDDYTGIRYHRESDVADRFISFEKDLMDMLDCHSRLNAGDLALGRESEDYVRGHNDALLLYTEELEFILRLRFPEFMKVIDDERFKDENNGGLIDLSELDKKGVR